MRRPKWPGTHGRGISAGLPLVGRAWWSPTARQLLGNGRTTSKYLPALLTLLPTELSQQAQGMNRPQVSAGPAAPVTPSPLNVPWDPGPASGFASALARALVVPEHWTGVIRSDTGGQARLTLRGAGRWGAWAAAPRPRPGIRSRVLPSRGDTDGLQRSQRRDCHEREWGSVLVNLEFSNFLDEGTQTMPLVGAFCSFTRRKEIKSQIHEGIPQVQRGDGG